MMLKTNSTASYLLSPRPFLRLPFFSPLSLRYGDKFVFWTPLGISFFSFLWRCRSNGFFSVALNLDSRRVVAISDLDANLFCARLDHVFSNQQKLADFIHSPFLSTGRVGQLATSPSAACG